MKMLRSLAPALVVLCLASLLPACSKKSSSPLSPTTEGTIYYTAIGASDTAGVGSSAPCFPFTSCPNGLGYVPVIARKMEAAGSTVSLSNLGIPGAFIGSDFQALAKQYGNGFPEIAGYELKGNFIEGEAPFVPRNSTIITIFAGGNDVRTVAKAINSGAGGSNPQAFLDDQIAAFRSDYEALLSAIRSRAPSAKIVVANLPNFAGMPYTASYSSRQKLWVQKISVGFSTGAINPLAAQNVQVVDLLCNSQFYSSSIYSSDGFHPNDTGYALLANLMTSAINGTSTPSASCGKMTLVR
jgi:lysophospholipase L1-like esterase